MMIVAALAPPCPGQNLGVATRIATVPPGLVFSVDGQPFQTAASAVWPSGSKHTLMVYPTTQFQGTAQFVFKGWAFGGTSFPGNPMIVTADPSIPEYDAVFDAQYDLRLLFYACDDPVACQYSPGVVYVGTVAYNSDQDIWMGAGSTVTLLAFPNPGFVFAGWMPGANQVIQGFQNTVTMATPVSVYPTFQVARRIILATVPAGLQVLADRAPVTTPTTMEWGWGSTHSVGMISPQQDDTGHWWIFSSWSDGGAPTHAYQVAGLIAADSLTATFVPAAPILLTTSPPGLSLTVDGKSNWPTYNFNWGVGETHSLQAPAQQTDSQGRIWAFASWSNGGPATQSFTVPASAAGTGVRLSATYNAVGHLTVNSTMAGLTVTVNGANCGTPCDLQFPVGTQVRVSAPASVPLGDGARADLSGWSGSVPAAAGDWVGTLGGDPVAISPNYQTMNRLSTAASPVGSASWSVQPGSPDGYYASQTTVNVSVTAQPGYRFHGWSGDLSGSVASGAVLMNAPRTVEALFDAAPYIAPTGVQNGAGSTPQPGVAAGSVISIFGANLASAVATGPDSPLTQTLSGTVVQAANRLLPLFFVSPGQINAQLPADFNEGSQTLTVSAQGQPDVHAGFTVVRNAPGLFQQVVNGQSFAVALHEDGSAVTPDSPARRGELLTVYGTGFGPTNPARPVGFAVPQTPPFPLLDAASVLAGGAVLSAENALAVPGRVAVDAVQFRLSDGAPSATNAPLRVRINGQESNTVLLPVQ
ncbi:MAG: hypothetical protein ABSG26_04495 [Bryobacteraceae bacterium]